MIPGLMNEMPIPAMADKLKNRQDYGDYSVKYIKSDIDDLAGMAELQSIETRGIAGDNVILLDRDKYVFMNNYFIILHYLEKNPE